MRNSRISVSALRLFLFAIVGTLATGARAQQTTPYLIWPQPSPIQFFQPLGSIQLDAMAYAGPPASVSLTANYNVNGIVTVGTPFAGGLDNGGESFSATDLGKSVVWNGIEFQLGPPDTLDAVSGGIVPLPAGQFANLVVLGDLVNNSVDNTGLFTVTYTDGTSTAVSQTLSDWVIGSNARGESVAACQPERVFFNGSAEANSTCVYAYKLPIDSTRTVASVTLPNNRDIVILAMALLPKSLTGTFTYSPAQGALLQPGQQLLGTTFNPAPGTGFTSNDANVTLTVLPPPAPLATAVQWPAPAPVSAGTALSATQLDATAASAQRSIVVPVNSLFRIDGIYNDGRPYREMGFDGTGIAFSAEHLGPYLTYAGSTFPLGPANIPDAITSTTVPLPAGNFNALQLVGAAAGEPQLAQPFTVTYADGTQQTQTLDMSPWTASQGFADETTVAATTVQNTTTGQQVNGTANIYGYTLALDPARTVASLALPANTHVILFGIALSSGTTTAVDGTLTYSPPAGTVLPIGQQQLTASFAPADPSQFGPSTATVNLTVERVLLQVTANNASRLFGQPNPAFSGSISGALAGDNFTETFTTPATIASPPATYPIVPQANGAQVAGYQLSITPGSLTVSKAPATLALSSSVQTVLQSNSVTLSALVQSTTTGTPQGTVEFFANGTAVGTAQLANGLATLLTSALPVGTNGISATYSGDTDFLPLSTPPAAGSLTVTVSPLDFLLTSVGTNTVTTTTGGIVPLHIHLQPIDGRYSADVHFDNTGQLPIAATLDFSPDTVPAADGGIDVTVMVHTRKLAQNRPFTLFTPQHEAIALCTVLLTPWLLAGARPRRHNLPRLLALALIALAATTAVTGCGTGYAAETYQFSVRATSGVVVHTLPCTLHILASPQ